jgi:NRPS condensation-like uncharacterized protein
VTVYCVFSSENEFDGEILEKAFIDETKARELVKRKNETTLKSWYIQVVDVQE